MDAVAGRAAVITVSDRSSRGERPDGSGPLLAELLAMVSLGLRAGRTRDEALRNLARRTGLAEMVALVTLLNQSAKLGSSIGQALKVYASEMRESRRMRAEEKANTLPTKMTLATMMLTVPPLLIILLGPSVYEISTVLNGDMP